MCIRLALHQARRRRVSGREDFILYIYPRKSPWSSCFCRDLRTSQWGIRVHENRVMDGVVFEMVRHYVHAGMDSTDVDVGGWEGDGGRLGVEGNTGMRTW